MTRPQDHEPQPPSPTGLSRFLGVLVLVVLPLTWWGWIHWPQPAGERSPAPSGSAPPAARQASPTPTAHIDEVFKRGYLRVVTRISPTIYVPDALWPQGIEHDLVRGFADRLGLDVQFLVADSVEEVYALLRRGHADLAAAGLTVSKRRRAHFRFGPSYMTVHRQLVHHRDHESPASIHELGAHVLNVARGTSPDDWLDTVRADFDNFVIHSRMEDTLDLVTLIEQGEVDYAVVHSHEGLIGQHVARNLTLGFHIGPPVAFAWAFSRQHDTSLLVEAEAYFTELRTSRRLNDLLDRYYTQFETLDRDLALAFMAAVERRLTPFERWFREAGARHDIDWRLLAAMGYKESKWDPQARSHMGAHGLMQITLPTARELGLTNPDDPRENILAAARYLDQLRDLVAPEAPEPDRSYLALAAYNIGMGHLSEARALTKRKGADPDRWRDVRRHLPLLMKPEYYRRSRYGFARGSETVEYVENIRAFHDLMIWVEQRRVRDRLAAGEEAATSGQ
ncbi:MAG: membrane-bound lytic murein transglycosylase MltF [Halothiobacillaceae bacterium]